MVRNPFQITRVLLAVLAVLALVGAFIVTVTMSASASPNQDRNGNTVVQLTNTTPCQDVVFLGVRGSGEKATDPKWGMGPRVTALYDSFIGAMKNRTIAATGVDYPANDIPRSVLIPDWANFLTSIDIGVDRTETILISRSHRCPSEHYVLGGYSQGAMVLHRMVFDFSRAPQGGLYDLILRRIDAVSTLGDGDRVAQDDVVNLGTSSVTAQDFGVGVALTANGANYVSTKSMMSTAGYGLNKRWFQVCDALDIVCDWGQQNAANAIAGVIVHLNSYTKKNSAVVNAGQQLASTSMAMNPLRLIYTASSATLGTPYSGTFNQTSGYPLARIVLQSGALPPGISHIGVDGISGIPTQSGLWNFTFLATDRVGQSFTGAATISVADYRMTIRIVSDPIPAQFSTVGYNARFHVLVKNIGTEKFWPGMLAQECSIAMWTYEATGQPPLDMSYISVGEEWWWDCWHPLTQEDITRGFYNESAGVFASADYSDVAHTIVIPTQVATAQVTVPVQMLTLTLSGQPINRYNTTWLITLTNTGNLPVTPQDLTSSACGTLPISHDILQPGASTSASCIGTMTETELAMSMQLAQNTVNETASGASGDLFSASVSQGVNVPF